jgi:hypothetical protein
MKNRSTQLLLFAIALALWGLLLRPVLAPAPARAQSSNLDGTVATNGVVYTPTGIFFSPGDGNLYKFDLSLNLQARAVKGFDNNGQPTFTRPQ